MFTSFKQSKRTVASSAVAPNMVAGSKASDLRLPIEKLDFITFELEFTNRANASNCNQAISGYLPLEQMFPPIRTVFYQWVENAAGVRTTDAHGNFIPVLDAEGDPVVVDEVLVHTDGSLLEDYGSLAKIHSNFTKREEKRETKITNAISLILEVTSDGMHRDLVQLHLNEFRPDLAWIAIKNYYEGEGVAEKRQSLDLLWANVPRTLSGIDKPTSEHIKTLITVIAAITSRYAALVPPQIVDDPERKSTFIRSLPKSCRQTLLNVNASNPELTYTQLSTQWFTGLAGYK